jgi:hypothetical protein
VTMVLSLLIPPKSRAPRGAYPFQAKKPSGPTSGKPAGDDGLH